MRKKARRPDLTFEEALRTFLSEEGLSLLTGISERNTCGRLAIFLERQIQSEGLNGYYADVEYNRKQEGQVKTIINDQLEIIRITSDLIVHTRGKMPPPHDNLIAVEVKKAERPESEKNMDRARLVAMTRIPYKGVWPINGNHPEHVCGYAVGIFLEIDIEKNTLILEFYKKGNVTKKKTIPIWNFASQ